MYQVQKRNIITLIILSLLTCGIYTLYLFYKQAEEINQMGDYQDNAALELLFTIVTCGVYAIYWHYKYAKRVLEIQQNKGMRGNDLSIINIVLSVFGLWIVANAILQSEMNNIIDRSVEGGPIYR
ncbi:MAG: DUF4234 domain-containing protein [Erysipelotrichaceae bacterium]